MPCVVALQMLIQSCLVRTTAAAGPVRWCCTQSPSWRLRVLASWQPDSRDQLLTRGLIIQTKQQGGGLSFAEVARVFADQGSRSAGVLEDYVRRLQVSGKNISATYLSHKHFIPCSVHGLKVGLLLHSTDALKMRARVLPSLLLAVVLLAAPLYLVARAPLAHRDLKNSSPLVQVDLALPHEHGNESSKTPLVQLDF